jgi:hypothetical protein
LWFFCMTLVSFSDDSHVFTRFTVAGAGDVNNDGFADILIASPYADQKTGIVYVVYGSSTLSGFNLGAMTTSQGYRVYGANVNERAGYAMNSAGMFIHSLAVLLVKTNCLLLCRRCQWRWICRLYSGVARCGQVRRRRVRVVRGRQERHTDLHPSGESHSRPGIHYRECGQSGLQHGLLGQRGGYVLRIE